MSEPEHSQNHISKKHQEYYKKVYDILMKWKANGINETDNSWGAVEICPTPHVADEAWLHTIFKGLSKEDITHLEKEMNKRNKKIPEDYKEYLSYMNGAQLFSDNLTLYGFSQSKIKLVIRDGVEANQPYDMVVESHASPSTWIRIGSIQRKRNEVYMDLDGKVYACEYRKTEIVKEWPSFWEYLLSQVEFLATKFDEKGVAIDKNYHYSVKEFLQQIEEKKKRKREEKRTTKKRKEEVKGKKNEDAPDEVRDAKTIARRTLALLGTLALAFNDPLDDVTSWLKDNDLWKELTPNELAYLTASNPTEKQRINATWKSECIIVLLWALGKIETLPAPNEQCDTSILQELLPPYGPISFADFISSAERRVDEVLIAKADELMDLHWQAVDARLNGREIPSHLDIEIIQERHHAINWVIGYDGLPWDDVTTDT